ncbi:MAG: DUF222 domain-containing protein [Acidimicrobiia bacterium]|nr:DUF222 domain-containing protein [Acidimicrobiia bacterium]
MANRDSAMALEGEVLKGEALEGGMPWSVDDRVDSLRRGVKGLTGEDYQGWLPSRLSEQVRELATVRERLEAEYVRLLAEWDRQSAWAVDGSLSPTAWLSSHTPVLRNDASRSVKTAQLIRDRHNTAEALASEAVTITQVATLAQAQGHGRGELLAQHEDVLLDAARGLDEQDFKQVVKQWMATADDHLGRASARHIHENRYFNLHTTFAGAVVVDGCLDPAAGAQLQAALERRVTPDPKDDPAPRSATQLRADALIELIDDAESGDNTSSRSRARANVNVIVDLPTLQGEPWTPKTRVELVGIGPVARETVQRLLCDSYLTRIITNGPSQVLDVGRSARNATEPQRTALMVRDGGCVFPTCTRDHRWTDAHHLTPYSEVAKTDLPDLVLLCKRHHTAVHDGGWFLNRDPETGEVTVISPDCAHSRSPLLGRAPP